MSKSLAELAQYLGASNEQLYDRYINFKLTREEPVEGAPPDYLDFQIRTPSTGIKPSITVSASFHVQNTANLITLTVVNIIF